MKFTIPVSQLTSVLSFVKLSLPKKDIEPVLKSILIKSVDSNKLLVSSTDLDLCSVAYTETQIDEQGEILLNGEKLLALVSRLSEGDLVISTNEQEVHFSCGSYHGVFPMADSEGYPEVKQIIDQNKSTTLNRQALLYALKRLEFAVCHEEVLKNLCCVEISPRGIVSSDSKVTAIYRESFNIPENIYISSNCVRDLIGVLDSFDVENVEIFYDEAYIIFRLGENIFFTRRISCKFPDVYTKILDRTENNPIAVTFRVKELSNVINRVSLAAPETTKAVVIRKSEANDAVLSASSGSGFSAKESLEFDTKGYPEDPEFYLAYNFDYLKKILARFSQEEITLKLASNIKIPTRIEDDKIVIFLMQTLIGE